MRRSAKFTVLGVLGAVLLLSGCTTYVSVASDPEGAVITSADGSETYGRAPVTIEYDRDTLEANLGKVPGFVATWPSGAKAATEAPCVISNTVRRLSCSARPMRLAWKKIFGLPWSRLKSALNVPKRIAAACSFITKAAGCTAHFSAQAFGISHSLFPIRCCNEESPVGLSFFHVRELPVIPNYTREPAAIPCKNFAAAADRRFNFAAKAAVKVQLKLCATSVFRLKSHVFNTTL